MIYCALKMSSFIYIQTLCYNNAWHCAVMCDIVPRISAIDTWLIVQFTMTILQIGAHTEIKWRVRC